ncbi:MAG: hypothetical protein AAF492_17615, partial [Verrucomicrobiota bacterium]
ITDPNAGIPVDHTIPGVFSLDGNGNFNIAQSLTRQLLQAVAPEIANNLAQVLPLDEINAKINELFEGSKPTILDLRNVLFDLVDLIDDTRGLLADNGMFFAELNDILDGAKGPGKELETIANRIFNELDDYFNDLNPANNGLIFEELTEAEVKAHMRTVIEDHLFAADIIPDFQQVIKQYFYDAQMAITTAIDGAFGQMNILIRDLLTDSLALLDDTLNSFTDDLASVVGGAELDGYAHINNDALKKLRIDLYLQMKVPDDMEFHGYVQICELDSEGDGGCSYGGGTATEVTLGAEKIPVKWAGSSIEFDVGAKFTFGQDGENLMLRGMGGHFVMTDGEISFQAFKITQFGAAVMFGLDENYLAAQVGVEFDGYEMAGGIFFGRTCTLDPIEMIDPDVAQVLGTPPFTGAYVYGEVYMPIINYTCMLRVSAGVGAGAFFFLEGPTYGGKIKLAAGGEVLCTLEAKGEIILVGSKSGNDFTFLGKGRLKGRLGWCDLCIKFDKTATAVYKDDKWDVDI